MLTHVIHLPIAKNRALTSHRRKTLRKGTSSPTNQAPREPDSTPLQPHREYTNHSSAHILHQIPHLIPTPRMLEDPPRPQNIILIGLMGCGKSTVGRILAKRIRFQIVDIDELIESRTGREIREIFKTDGEESFRRIESITIESIAHMTRCIIATGGGAVLRPENREALKKTGFVIWLTASLDTLFERVSRNNRRPLLQTPNPRQTLSDLMSQREPFYRETADATFDTSEMELEDVAAHIEARVRDAFGWNRQRP
jgi:shikimate kinase